jgi:hypothetical protein
MAMGQRFYNEDLEMLFKDAGLIAADDNAQVGGVDKIIDVGTSSRFEAVMVIDVSAIEIASNDELYHIIVQGSNSATFASGIENLAMLSLGATEVRPGAAQDSTTGRYELPFCNEQADATYRYLRVAIDVDGTIATGINFTAFASTKY